ncbi:MAG TPA: hypothetical protein VGK74_14335 [Symbiobacteriaceae bacterium]|jgi:hypothetical protein
MPAAHFIRASANCSGNDLQVCFMEAGLGSNQTVTITASATATATYVCLNRGGRRPQAANKITVVADVSVSGEFTSGQSGQISGCLFVSPPGPGNFSCPSGQTLVLQDVSYSNVEVSDDTNGPFIDIPGTFVC